MLIAIEEFGEKGYDNASINTICAKYSISKGLIHHNFKNKDELYLWSVEESFTKHDRSNGKLKVYLHIMNRTELEQLDMN